MGKVYARVGAEPKGGALMLVMGQVTSIMAIPLPTREEGA